MNLVGKILVVLVLIMSVCFMGFAVAVYSTHKNWYEALTRDKAAPNAPLGLVHQLKLEKQKNIDLQTENERLVQSHKTEIDARQKVLGELETKRATLDKELKEKIVELADLRSQNTKALSDLEITVKALDDKLTQIAMLSAEINTARTERDDNFKKSVELTDKLHQAEGTLSLLKDQSTRLAEQMAQAKVVLERNHLKLDSPVGPPSVDGIVLAASSNGMVEISLGSDDGLQRGHVLEVFRLGASTSKYLGKIEIVQTQPEKSVARVIPEFRKGIIEKQDRVATQLR
jgi:hypothetical protein